MIKRTPTISEKCVFLLEDKKYIFTKYPETRNHGNCSEDKYCDIKSAMKLCIDRGYKEFTYNRGARNGGRAWFVDTNTRKDEWLHAGFPNDSKTKKKHNYTNCDHYVFISQMEVNMLNSLKIIS
jgi:hypothetical protein